MKISPQRKIGLALLGVGIVALICDRLFFAPASAEAAGAAAAEHAAAPLPVRRPPAPAPAPGPPAVTLATRVADGSRGLAWDAARVPDGFHPANSWLMQARMGPPAPAGEAAPVASSENRPLQYNLMMIFRRDGVPTAIIDHRAYRVGEFLDGMKITGIDPASRSVELDGPAGPLTLSISGGLSPSRR